MFEEITISINQVICFLNRCGLWFKKYDSDNYVAVS